MKVFLFFRHTYSSKNQLFFLQNLEKNLLNTDIFLKFYWVIGSNYIRLSLMGVVLILKNRKRK